MGCGTGTTSQEERLKQRAQALPIIEVKNIAKADSLPDYRVHYDANSDQVMFYTKDSKALAMSMKGSERVSSDNESPQ